MIDPQRPPSRVTLEDLLRVKRSERPPAEFWLDFEQSLRAKQLAAIVEKRPWWRRRSLSSFSRWSLPAGAAAALLLTVATVASRHPRSQPSTELAQVEPRAPAATRQLPISSSPNVTVAATEAPQSTVVSAAPSSSIAQVEPVAVSPAIDRSEAAALPSIAMTDAPARNHLASVTEQIAGIGLDGSAEGETRALPRFASTSQKESAVAADDLNAFFEHAVAHLDSSMRSERVSAVEPLSQLPTPRDARRARLLAFTSSLDTHSPQYSNNSNVIRSRERITSHLSEEALYDSIRRLGIKNGGVSIQF